MNFRRLPAAICVFGLLGISSALCAQRTDAPTLDEILSRLETNLNHNDSDLPSLFCDEHVVSRMEPGPRDRDTVTDSVFRVRRVAGPDHTTSLEESREVKSVNGRAATARTMEGPSLVSGVFEGGLAVVSPEQKVCMRYALERTKRSDRSKPYVVRFATELTAENSGSCLLQEKSEGRAFIDPRSMEITRLELTTPHHVIVHGSYYAAAEVGKRTLTVDYAPVVLGGERFWLPSEISQRAVSGANSFRATEWTYRATYSGCHRTEVTSRILSGAAATP